MFLETTPSDSTARTQFKVKATPTQLEIHLIKSRMELTPVKAATNPPISIAPR